MCQTRAMGFHHLKYFKLWDLLVDVAMMERVKRDTVYNVGIINEEQATAL